MQIISNINKLIFCLNKIRIFIILRIVSIHRIDIFIPRLYENPCLIKNRYSHIIFTEKRIIRIKLIYEIHLSNRFEFIPVLPPHSTLLIACPAAPKRSTTLVISLLQ